MNKSALLTLLLWLYMVPIFSQNRVQLDTKTENRIQQLYTLKKGESMYLKLSVAGEERDFKLSEKPSAIPMNLHEKFPEIRNFYGKNSAYELSLTLTNNRFFGFITNGSEVFDLTNTNTFHKKNKHYKLHSPSAITDQCSFEKMVNSGVEILNSQSSWHPTSSGKKKPLSENGKSASRGNILRTYNLVLTVTGKQNKELGNTTKEEGMAYALNVLNFINSVFGRELAVQFKLHPQNEKVIYLDPETDPYPNEHVHDMVDLLKTHNDVLFSLFDPSSFDTGLIIHPSVVARGGGRPGNSSRAFVGSCACNGLILHELAHHLGGRHSYHLDSSDELGRLQHSMVGNNSSYLHSFNFEHITNTIENSSVGSSSSTGNTPPKIIDFKSNLAIPKGTPFELTGSATDPDLDANLTYTWQQMQGGNTTSEKLLFAHKTPSTENSTRHIPSLESQLTNTTDAYAILPEVDRELIARFVVRDNQVPVGGVSYEELTLTVDASAGPFKINHPNTETEFLGGTEISVAWDVAQTDNEKINVKEVNILLSADHGTTWSALASNTPNDGSQVVMLPNISSTQCRIKIAAANNIFYAISDANFSILKTVETGFELDTAEIILNRKSGTASFQVVLVEAPFSDVVFDLSLIEEGQATVNPDQLTFTPNNWSTSQIATVTALTASQKSGFNSKISVRVNEASDPSFHQLETAVINLVIVDEEESDLSEVPEAENDTHEHTLAAEAFTPNGDGINDYWIIRGIENHPKNKIQLFNRQGVLVHQINGYRNNWNGTLSSNSSTIPRGLYHYQIELGNETALINGWLFVNY